MEHAGRKIDDLLFGLNGDFHRLRQRAIDEGLIDVFSGYEELDGASNSRGGIAA